MAVFKYTIANKQGQKLVGTIEAPDETKARSELNNLGFSILKLQETDEVPQEENPEFIRFSFEAIDKNSRIVSGTVPAKSKEEAFLKLKNEYNLTVSAIWLKDATPEQIKVAREEGSKQLQEEIIKKEESEGTPDPEQRKQEAEMRTKIDNILHEVSSLLQTFNKDFNAQQKAEINKRIDKLLRIKNSTNFDYIFETAQELLQFIQAQSDEMKEQGHEEDRIKLKMDTKRLLGSLNKSEKVGIADSFLAKIERLEQSEEKNQYLFSFLKFIQSLFYIYPEVITIKKQIKTYNKQIFELIKLYFKEPTSEYKDKVKKSIKSVWGVRKKTVKELKETKKRIRGKHRMESSKENFIDSFIVELNSFTGWLLFFYLLYYFGALYLNTKDFGLPYVPSGFELYDSIVFKYVFAILFLLHSCTSLKVNFFRHSFLAILVLLPIFFFGSIIVLFNF
jgi:hypothetical protein